MYNSALFMGLNKSSSSILTFAQHYRRKKKKERGNDTDTLSQIYINWCGVNVNCPSTPLPSTLLFTFLTPVAVKGGELMTRMRKTCTVGLA